MSCVGVILCRGALLSVCREQHFVLTKAWVVWEFPSHHLGQQLHWTKLSPTTGSLTGDKRWPVGTLHAPLFNESALGSPSCILRCFHCTLTQMPPKSSCFLLNSIYPPHLPGPLDFPLPSLATPSTPVKPLSPSLRFWYPLRSLLLTYLLWIYNCSLDIIYL